MSSGDEKKKKPESTCMKLFRYGTHALEAGLMIAMIILGLKNSNCGSQYQIWAIIQFVLKALAMVVMCYAMNKMKNIKKSRDEAKDKKDMEGFITLLKSQLKWARATLSVPILMKLI